MRKFFFYATAWLTLLGGVPQPVIASPREDVISLIAKATETHDRLRGAEAAADSARNGLRISHGGWYPTLSLSANGGRETTEKPAGLPNTDLNAGQLSIRATQLIWDFDATNADIRRAQVSVVRADIAVERTRQELLVEGLSAYANLVRAHRLLTFARQSEDNIRRQTGLEEVRLQEGYGFSTDVLQAKSQLAGAQARRVAAEEAMQTALSRFQAYFGHVSFRLDGAQVLAMTKAALPASMDAAVEEARRHNPRLQELALTTAAAEEAVTSVRGRSLYPRVEGFVERNVKRDVAGQPGRQNELLFKLQVTFSLNTGLTAINSVRLAEADLRAADASWADQERTVLETVRNSWNRLESARSQVRLLNDQASLAAGFLDVARAERELGSRSLIDILSGETTLINARSDAAAAETELVLAGYRLLAAMGRLNAADIQTKPMPKSAAMGRGLFGDPGRQEPAPPANRDSKRKRGTGDQQ
ncbi:outer membrane protein, adhesin transport system [Azospirillum oryzae]|uniref:Outer membrane protein, adhesin transport system n=1 Tax=Azospirillum oryzae TaxID=286727 RepID=A0A1X7FGI3_9PROT|nr:outer membrane protein, adhesin transport system [Azospirillum oryzae]